ncbi:MAG TPA: hypothetical protein VF761_09385 [Gemmatimonadaceae bacterium]
METTSHTAGATMRTLILLAACAAACSAPARSAARAPAADTATRPAPVRGGHAGVDLSGSWVTGSTGEPAAARIELQPQCNYTPGFWELQQSGDTLRAWRIPESYARGVATPVTAPSIPAEGMVSGMDVVIGTAGSRYLLRYDSTSGHLRGTLNGAPFWAVRVDIVRRRDCIPVP